MHRQGDVSAALSLKLLDKSAAIGDDDGFVPLLSKEFTDFESARVRRLRTRVLVKFE